MRTAPTGCLSLLVFGLVLALPFVLANAFLTALTKLGIGPLSALGVAVGIFVGGAINIPVARVQQAERVEYRPTRLLGLHRFLGRPVRHRAYTVVAVNVGGCLVPTVLAGYQVARMALEAPADRLCGRRARAAHWGRPAAPRRHRPARRRDGQHRRSGHVRRRGPLGPRGDAAGARGAVGRRWSASRTVGRLSVAFTPVVLRNRTGGVPNAPGRCPEECGNVVARLVEPARSLKKCMGK